MTASILHVDMDAFFASVELLRHPELVGKPVVVGGSGNRGVVAAASYEARSYGIYSAMPSRRAKRLCRDLVFISGDYEFYVKASERIMNILKRFTPLVEPLSLDEAFLDIGGVRRVHGEPKSIAYKIRDAIYEEEGLRCSVGVSVNKFLAKLSSENAKPKVGQRGPVYGESVFLLDENEIEIFLDPLPVDAIWGVGPKTHKKLNALGIETVGELSRVSEGSLVSSLGKAAGQQLWRLARGIDNRNVVVEQEAKSIGHEETFSKDLTNREDVERELVRLVDSVSWRLRKSEKKCRTVSLKVRYSDFTTFSRSYTFPDPTSLSSTVLVEAKKLLGEVDLRPGVRLLGISVTNFDKSFGEQLKFSENPHSNRKNSEDAVDLIRDRFGVASIGPASILGSSGMRVKRKGEQQWGPDENSSN